MSQPDRRQMLSQAARELLAIIAYCPEILRVVPIDEEDMQTLHELAYGDDEEEGDYAPE